MAVRSTWKGYLKLSLVTMPVKGYSASEPAANVVLHQLHADCHSRIRYQKTCPVHGEVTKDEIVSGYEYAKGQYVVIEPGEVEKLRTDEDRAITVDAIVPQATIDPLYFTHKTYYLVPDGAAGQKPFVLLQHGLAEDGLEAVARGILFGREELVVIRPVENVLAMTALKYQAEVRQPSLVSGDVEKVSVHKPEAELARTLLKSFLRRDFSLGAYKDEYAQKLKTLIAAKVEGKEVVAPAESHTPQVINLMEALKKSVASAASGRHKRPAHARVADSRRSRPRRKSG
jgi:DNA end-binding protein Ku